MRGCILELIEILAALLTPTIGVIATYIAYQQYSLNRKTTKRELLDRRLTIFKSCMAYIAKCVQQNPNSIETTQFLRETADSFYLFKDDLTEYLSEVYKKGLNFEYYGKMLNDPNLPVGEKRTQFADKNLALQEWFTRQLSEAREMFKPYLDVRD